MYKIVMIVAVAVVAVGWVGYGIYNYIENRREAKQPRRSHHLQQAHESMNDYAKRMEEFEKKRYKRQQ